MVQVSVSLYSYTFYPFYNTGWKANTEVVTELSLDLNNGVIKVCGVCVHSQDELSKQSMSDCHSGPRCSKLC